MSYNIPPDPAAEQLDYDRLGELILRDELGPQPVSGGKRRNGTTPDTRPVSLPIRLSDNWDEEEVEILPELVSVEGGLPLLYRGESNMIAGPGGTGKSWIGYRCVMDVAANKEIAVIIDYESNLRTVRQRLKALGTTKEQASYIMYWKPSGSLMSGSASRNALDGFFSQYPECFLLLDSVAKALSAAGKNENDNTEYNEYDSDVFQSWTDARITSLLIDHTGHQPEGRYSRQKPRGASSKIDRISGVAYGFEAVKPWSKDQSGYGHLTPHKDREGNRLIDRVSVVVNFELLPGRSDNIKAKLTFSQYEPPVKTESGKPQRISHMRIIATLIEESDTPPSGNALKQAAKAKGISSKSYAEDAMAALEELGYIKCDRNGTRNSYTTLKPFTEGDAF